MRTIHTIAHSLLLGMVLLILGAGSAPAADSTSAERSGDGLNLFTTFTKRVGETWDSGSYDIYVPLYTWHNRFMYDDRKIRQYNEEPWGFGIGKSMYDEDGDWHALYAMGFADSHKQFQPMLGYAFIKNWYLNEARDFALGAGFTVGVTARHEYDYIPLPLPLPLISVQYKRFSIQAAYVPGLYNDGNVLFTWFRLNI